jgi:hypothetical protein
MYSIIGHQQEIVDEGGTCDGCSLLSLTPLKKKKKNLLITTTTSLVSNYFIKGHQQGVVDEGGTCDSCTLLSSVLF